MKKLQLSLIFVFFAILGLAQSQNEAFQVRFIPLEASCYNNAKVVYALVDSAGNALDSLPPGITNVRFYYKTSETDSVQFAGWHYVGGYDTVNLNHGTYTIGVEALMSDGNAGFFKADTHTVLTLSTSYQRPTASSVVYHAWSRLSGAGTLYTIPCADIGRVQLLIENGTFPYTVTIINNETGDTLRTEVFESRQYNGNDRTKFNYKDYYSISNLPKGNWGFYIVDGCGYGLPRIDQTVTEKEFPRPQTVFLFVSSGNFADSNVIHLQLSYSSEDVLEQQALMHQYVRYRINYGDLGEGEWKSLPLVNDNSTLYPIYDTASIVNRYCDLWDHELRFEYKVENCGAYEFNRPFSIKKPKDEFFDKKVTTFTDSTTVGSDECSMHSYWHQDHYSIRYYSSAYSPYYFPDYTTSNLKHDYYRYYYTHPLTWIYTDVPSGGIIKKDTVANIVTKSLLTLADVNHYYGLSDTGHVIIVERKLLDRKGCIIYSDIDTLDYRQHHDLECVVWEVQSTHDPDDHCCNAPRQVKVFTTSSLASDRDSTVIRLVRSPYNNLYNFTATYLKGEQRWEVQRDSLSNQATIFGEIGGCNLVISDYCLPSGPYEFEIHSHCGDYHLSKEVAFPGRYEMRTDHCGGPTLTRDCSNFRLTYDSCRFQRIIYNTSPETGLPLDPVIENRIMRVDVIESPDKELYRYYEGSLPITLNLSLPGTYIFHSAPSEIDGICEAMAERYDTIVIDNSTVEFVDVRAVLCDTSSTSGTVWVESTNGTKPYTFTLFDHPNKTGDTLGVNHTGLFVNVPMTSSQTLSCFVQDSCNAYFHINFQPTTIAKLQKVWFDGHASTMTACEGATIQAHALSLDNIIQYEWTGPDGFHSTTADPTIFVPYGYSNGWYKVTLRETGCAEELSDSIFLTILQAPDIALSADTTVCPSEATTVRFTPESANTSGEITFSIAFENADGTTVRQYATISGATVADTFTTLSPAKIYPVGIDDGFCDHLPAHPDTMHLHLRTDLTPNCNTLTTYDTVCVGGEAHLSAHSTLEPPYYLRWHGDYYQKQLLKAELITEDGQWSTYDTAGIMGKTILYISLQKGDACPSSNGLIDNTMQMQDGTTTLACGQHLRLYDDGIADSLAILGEDIVHRFSTVDGTRLCITFDQLNLSPAAHLQVFTGDEPILDSLLGDFGASINTLSHFVSNGNTLTLRFFGRDTRNTTWSAIVESAPGIAVADIKKGKTTFLSDEVCQSQTNTYHDRCSITPELATAEELNHAIRKTGNYYFSKMYPAGGSNGCDSLVSFTLTVNMPAISDTTVLATLQDGFLWRDSIYRESGRYVKITTSSDGCDKLDILTLKVLDAHCSDGEICKGDTVSLNVTASLTAGKHQDNLIPRRAYVGDILCTDGSILSFDTFINSGKTPEGVVFFVDQSGIHGIATALKETSGILASSDLFNVVVDFLLNSALLLDCDGMRNTRNLLMTVEQMHLSSNPNEIDALNYCYHYNPEIGTADLFPHGWHLPSVGETNLLISNYTDVNKTLKKMNQYDNSYQIMTSPTYWTSSIYSYSEGWVFKKGKASHSNNQDIHGIRPAINF